MRPFAEWLATTGASVFMQDHQSWVIPAIQSVHIVGIAVVMGSVFLIDLRILGWAGTDQTLRETIDRFGPWLTSALWLMLATGLLMVVAEPVRELVTFSFWAKMLLVAVGVVVLGVFQGALRRRERLREEERIARYPFVRTLTLLTFLLWAAVIVLGRLIAYDHVWGAWSPAKTQ
jgi:putative copper export protein